MPDISIVEFAATFDRAALQPLLEEAEAQRQTIVDQFPRDGLRTLEMTRYADDREDRATLGWLLTGGTPALGNIPGVAFNATGLHKLKGSGLYRSTLTATGDAAEDWKKLREGLAQCCELVLSQQWEAINQVPYTSNIPSLRTKLLFVYFPDELLPIYASTEVGHFLEALGVGKSIGQGKWSVVHNRALLAHLRTLPNLAGWSTMELASLLRGWFPKPKNKSSDMTQPELVREAMKAMLADAPEENACVTPDQVQRYVEVNFNRDIAACGTVMADMVAPGLTQTRTSKVPLALRVLERVRLNVYRLLPDMALTRPGSTDQKTQTTILMPAPVLNQILYGPPGTGKTYRVIREAAAIVAGQTTLTDLEAKAVYDRVCAEGRVRLVTFHQSFSYEDFIEGIRPVMEEDGEAKFQVRDGVFKEIATDALFACLELAGSPSAGDAQYQRPGPGTKTGQVWDIADALITEFGRIPTRPEIMQRAIAVGTNKNTAGTQASRWRISKGFKDDDLSAAEVVQSFLSDGISSGWQMRADENYPPYVLVVDEINRGNISRIFGELITLIEDDKREGRANALRVTLPCSQQTFTVPPNLFVLGTMNTADKSLALLDVALRRRFEFRELAPDFSVCGLSEDMRSMLESLNKRIELRKDRDHRIGHAFFMGVGDAEGFNRVFVRKVVPLLQEYFFNDIDGARFVLGEVGREAEAGFLRQITAPSSEAKYQRNRWRWFTDVEPGMDCWARLRSTLGVELA